MDDLSDSDREFLLNFARETIAAELDAQRSPLRPETLSPVLKEKRGCFVTLHKKGDLRGCIGTIEPTQPLVDGVEENAKNAAFGDPRFPPVTADELPEVELEISLLTLPRHLEFADPEDLLRQLKPGVHGVILQKDWHRATFLPQVWKQLPDVRQFLGHLCLKAGLGRDCWKEKDLVVKVYEVEYFAESGR